MLARQPTFSFPALYLTEAEIAHRVLGEDAIHWPDLAAVWEKEGLPRRDPMTGMRFWPAVDAWFKQRHGLTRQAVPTQADGVETWP
jgi:hypothetical protein